jgi:ADP-ribosylglycohydrolase
VTTGVAERVHGMLAGVAVGDALGMPVEFLTPERIRELHGELRGFAQAAPDHPHHHLPAGSVTDDTDQTVIVARLIVERGRVETAELAARLLAWSRTPRVRDNRFVGPTTLAALEAIAAGRPVPPGGTTVGAAMRVAPLAAAFPDRNELEAQVVASALATHDSRNAISGAMAMAFALADALRADATPRSVARAAQEGAVVGRDHGQWSWTPPLERRIDHAVEWAAALPEAEALSRFYELLGVDMYPEQLVPAALGLVVLTGGEPMRAMRLAAGLGGDADTLASLAGSICGALGGIEGFDAELARTVETVNGLDLRGLAAGLVRHRLAREVAR